MPPKKGPEAPTERDSSQVEFEHDMDPKLREDILKLFDKSLDDVPKITRTIGLCRRTTDILNLLGRDPPLQELFNEEVVLNQSEDAKAFFGKKSVQQTAVGRLGVTLQLRVSEA